MTMELIARKRKFFFTYESIDSPDMNTILNLLWESGNMFTTLSYVENNVTKSAVVYVGAIPSELNRTDNSDWVWTGVNFDLIER